MEAPVGISVGWAVRSGDGAAIVEALTIVGPPLRLALGELVGAPVGISVGCAEGSGDGTAIVDALFIVPPLIGLLALGELVAGLRVGGPLLGLEKTGWMLVGSPLVGRPVGAIVGYADGDSMMACSGSPSRVTLVCF